MGTSLCRLPSGGHGNTARTVVWLLAVAEFVAGQNSVKDNPDNRINDPHAGKPWLEDYTRNQVLTVDQQGWLLYVWIWVYMYRGRHVNMSSINCLC